MSDLVRIAAGGLTARITPLGAELHSLTDSAGREYMTAADPAFWTGHAPLLFPIVGALNGGGYRLGGAEYALPRHGFARRSTFEVLNHDPQVATFRLSDNEGTRAVYPFAFDLQVTFGFVGFTLRVEARVKNTGAARLPFSFGYHPAFAWPLPGGGDKLAHEMAFECEEPSNIRRLDVAGLVATSEPTPVVGSTMPLDPAQYEADAMIWDELASRRVIYRGVEGGPSLEIAFPEMPYLGIWQKPGADFICIEPWAGIADSAGFTGDFREKPGVMQLPSGAARTLRMDITVHPARIQSAQT